MRNTHTFEMWNKWENIKKNIGEISTHKQEILGRIFWGYRLRGLEYWKYYRRIDTGIFRAPQNS